MLSLDLHGWEAVMLVSLALAAAAAISVGWATYKVVMFQREEAREAALKIAEAQKESSRAIEHAATLGVSVNNLEEFTKSTEAKLRTQYGELRKFVEAEEKRNLELIDDFNRNRDALDAARKDSAASVVAAKKVLAEMEVALKAQQDMRDRMLELVTPRRLSDLQFADLKNRLRKFPKTPFDMFAGSSSSVEVNELVARVASALEDAGWIWKPSKNGDFALSIPGKPEVALLVSTGIHIEIAESQRGALEGAAVALRDGLVANGLKVSAVIIPDAEIRPNFDKSCIHVVIGGKQ